MYVNVYRLVRFVLDLHTHVCMHAHGRTCTPARKTHPSHMLTSVLPQNGKTPLEVGNNNEVKTAFAELAVITDDNKNMLLLECARFGIMARVRAMLQAGADLANTDQVRVRA